MSGRKFYILSFLSACLLSSCSLIGSYRSHDSDKKQFPDTLHVVTMYGPKSYFLYRGLEMGFDYENLCNFADEEGYVLDLKVAPSLQSLLAMIKSGEAQLAAYPIPRIEEYEGMLRHCGPGEVTSQVLVQPSSENNKISDVTQLIGKTVYVEKDSKYEFRMRNLNEELGGGINLITIDRDTLNSEDIINMVDRGEISYTVVDSDIAEINRSYFPRLDISLKVGLDQYSSWAVNLSCGSLADKLDKWKNDKATSSTLKQIYKKYFEQSRQNPFYENTEDAKILSFDKKGKLSPYDHLFKKYSSIPGYDWRFLAALSFNESRFDNDVVSWAGARGVMQLMPSTAQAVGVDATQIHIPEMNILAASRLLKKLDEALVAEVPDKEERLYFVAAAYNSGLGHILDAITLAKKNGLKPSKWTGNVQEATLLKSKPQYYNDPSVKNGYFRARETIEFVDNVMSSFFYIKKMNSF